MASDRCPSCAALVRAGDGWCPQCFADLRAPEPPPPVSHDHDELDPLTAPIGVLLDEPPPAVPVVTWPCVECGAANALDLDSCGVCTAPFGGRIARLADPADRRRKTLLYGLGAVGVFLALLAGITLAATKEPPKEPVPVTVVDAS